MILDKKIFCSLLLQNVALYRRKNVHLCGFQNISFMFVKGALQYMPSVLHILNNPTVLYTLNIYKL